MGGLMIFFDSSFIIGLIISSDNKHHKAVRIKEKLASLGNERRVINNIVLGETLNSFGKFSGKQTKEIFNMLHLMYDVVYLTSEDYNKAIDIYLYYNGSINFHDCLILQTMEKMQINKIVTFDNDFRKVNGLKIIN